MVDYVVHNDTELMRAVGAAKGGETIKLAAGTYTSLNLSNKAFSSAVTVTSLDPSNPATIGGVKLTTVSNMTFKSIDLGRAVADAAANAGAAMAKLSYTNNITFDTVHVHGSLDNNAMNDVQGITVGNSKNIKIVNSEFEQVWKALGVGASENVTLSNNKVHDVRSDGFDFVSSTNVLIENNKFSNFVRGSTDHPDAIQFWTTNSSRPSTNIVIRNNEILQGSGTSVQGIFMRDDKGGLPYENVTIENNVVYTQNHANGITVIGGKNINVLNNTVVSPTDDTIKVNIRLQAIAGATVSNNISDGVVQSGTSMTFSGNRLTANTDLASLLKTATMASITAGDLMLSDIGFQLFSGIIGSTTGVISPTPTVTSPTPVVTSPTTTVTSPTQAVTSPTTTVSSPTTTVTSPTSTITKTNKGQSKKITGSAVSKVKITASPTTFQPATLSDQFATGSSALSPVPLTSTSVSTSTWAAATQSQLLSTFNLQSLNSFLAATRI